MKRRAFTLVELLVVIAIVGLLSTVAVIALTQSSINARNQKRKADLLQISKALELYYNDNGGYPITTAAHAPFGVCNGNGSFTVRADVDPSDYPTNTSWIPGLSAGGYMARLPRDPNTSKTNPLSGLSACRSNATYSCYIYESNGLDYLLAAHCTPEGTIASSDPFYYPGAGSTYMYVMRTSGANGW